MRQYILICSLLSAAALAESVKVPVRSRVELFKGSDQWQQTGLQYDLPTDRTAIVVCDMWDKHWCRGATGRVGQLAPKADAFLKKARAAGLVIVHAPSETMGFYSGAPQRKAILDLPKATPPAPLDLKDPAIPVDSSDGGCDTDDKFYKAWGRQHAGLEIGPNDFISDNGNEIYNLLHLRGITHLLIMGVHTNMCILNRTFAIRNMTRWGMKCILVRDLTDAMYDPKDKPYVSHERGTEMVIEHIEKYWAPSTLSSEILKAIDRP